MSPFPGIPPLTSDQVSERSNGWKFITFVHGVTKKWGCSSTEVENSTPVTDDILKTKDAADMGSSR